jgi:PrtD family type I secretion system ABC transporter
LRNAEVLQAMGMLPALRARWMTRQTEVLDFQTNASERSGLLVSAAKFVRAFLQIAILGAGGYLAMEQELSPAAMIAASIIMGRALAPVELSVTNWSRFLGARNAYARIVDLFKFVPEAAARMRLPDPQGKISVDDVYASPPDGKYMVLQGISFALQPGELLGIIGQSGSGKSTLARVLVGVWPIMRGEVRIDGAELAHWNPEQLGPHVGYLPQDIELFPGTIAENIARFGSLDEDKIVEAAKLAGVHDMVQALPEGYNTQIGEGGSALSGGQRQRIGLARALHGKPALIVLDEPNASLDTEGEAALIDAVAQLRKERRAVVLITHKTSILARADKILILNDGRVQAFGDRDDIMGPAQVASATKVAIVR